MAQPAADHGQARVEADARSHLQRAGGAAIPRMPWLHRAQPPSAVDLIQSALWHARTAEPPEEDLAAALALLPAARAELDQVEAALLFAARAHGMSWSRISRAMGLRSTQAAQQRFDRVAGRVAHRERA